VSKILTLQQLRYAVVKEAVLRLGKKELAAVELEISRMTLNDILRRRGGDTNNRKPRGAAIAAVCGALLLFVVGCSGSKSAIRPPSSAILPPIPDALESTRAAAAPAPRALIAPPARPARLEWSPNYAHPETVTEIWSTTNLAQPFELRQTVAGASVTLPQQPQEFFLIRNRLGDHVSEWNTK
jgi:hypothetical protein